VGEGEGGARPLSPGRIYRIELRPAARRSLAGLPREAQARIASAIDSLAPEPRPPGVTKLRGPEKASTASAWATTESSTRSTTTCSSCSWCVTAIGARCTARPVAADPTEWAAVRQGGEAHRFGVVPWREKLRTHAHAGSVRPVRQPRLRNSPKGPVRDRNSASAEPTSQRQVARFHTETTRSIPLGSTSASRYSRGTSALFGSRLLGVARSGTRQGPVARGSAPSRAACCARLRVAVEWTHVTLPAEIAKDAFAENSRRRRSYAVRAPGSSRAASSSRAPLASRAGPRSKPSLRRA
jgi:hypothetical protein